MRSCDDACIYIYISFSICLSVYLLEKRMIESTRLKEGDVYPSAVRQLKAELLRMLPGAWPGWGDLFLMNLWKCAPRLSLMEAPEPWT